VSPALDEIVQLALHRLVGGQLMDFANDQLAGTGRFQWLPRKKCKDSGEATGRCAPSQARKPPEQRSLRLLIVSMLRRDSPLRPPIPKGASLHGRRAEFG
jgi:hypothetical protein